MPGTMSDVQGNHERPLLSTRCPHQRRRGLARPALLLLALGATGGAWAPLPAQGARLLTPGSHEVTIRHDGMPRSYRVFVPPGVRRAPRPLMVAFHGGGGTARQFQESAGLDAVARREGFIVAYPDGTGRFSLHTWNAGGCCGPAADRRVDDLGFVRALLADVAQRIPVDPHRIYVTGHSNGAMMSYRVAAELGDLLAAAVPVGGAMHLAGIQPTGPVPILHIHSVDDPRALYGGGEGPPFPGTERRVIHPAVEDGLRTWREANGCPDTPSTGRVVHGGRVGTNANQTATELRWEPCASGMPVVHWRLTGSGHGWPGATATARRAALIGPATSLISAAEEAWRFASQFRKP